MDTIGYILICLAALSVLAGISRWIFKVNDQIENQETIIQLLGQLLLQQGLTVEEVSKILSKKNKK